MNKLWKNVNLLGSGLLLHFSTQKYKRRIKSIQSTSQRASRKIRKYWKSNRSRIDDGIVQTIVGVSSNAASAKIGARREVKGWGIEASQVKEWGEWRGTRETWQFTHIDMVHPD